MAHTWTKIGELEEFSAGGLIKADDFNEIHEEIRDSVNDFVDEVDEVIEDLEEADTALGTRMTAAEGNITSHGTRLTTAEGTITSHGSTLTSHGSTLTNHGSRLTTAESDIDAIETSVESTQEDVEDLEDALDTVEARVDETEDDIETLETLVAANTTAITNEATRAGGVEAGLNTRLGTAESTITSHGTRLTTAENSIASQGTRLGTAENTITSHTGTLTGHTNTLGQHTNSINNHNNRLSVAEGNISTLNTNKQNKLTAGENITIENNVISATGGSQVTELFWCTYGTTTEAEIVTALEAGKLPVMLYSGKTYVHAFVNAGKRWFSSAYSTVTCYTYVDRTTNEWGNGNLTLETRALKKTTITGYETSNDAYPTTKAVYDFAQPRLTAGTNVTISNNVISAIDTNSVFKIDSDTPIADIQAAQAEGKVILLLNSSGSTYLLTFENTVYYYFTSFHSGGSAGVRVYTAQLKKSDHTWTSSSFMLQNQLTAGTGITISDNVISATGGGGVTVLDESGTYVDVIMAMAAGSLVIYENSDTMYRWICQGMTIGGGAEISFARIDIYDGKPIVSYGLLAQDGTLADLSEENCVSIGEELYWCTYGTTTAAQIQTALDAGKVPMMKYGDGVYHYAYRTSTYHYFTASYSDVSRWITVKRSDSTYNMSSRGLESTSFKKSSIEGNETSTAYYPSTSAVYDYAEPKHQDFRLLNDITLSGEESITLTADGDGIPYNFKEIMIVGNNVKPSDETVSSVLKMYAYNGTSIIGGMYVTNWKTSRYMRSYVKYEGGFYRSENQVASGAGNWNEALSSESSTAWLQYDTTARVNKIIISSNTQEITMASGNIKIYGR